MSISSEISRQPSIARNEATESFNSPLVNYALNGLQKCWLPEHGRWSHIYHLDGRAPPNESLPHSDVFYTLNVLLGLSKVKHVPDTINVPAIFEETSLQLTRLPVAKYAYGMALWAAAELRLDIPSEIVRHINNLLSDKNMWWNFRAQDTGMLLSGLVAQVRAGHKQWLPFANALFVFLAEKYHSQSDFFFDSPSGFRQRFASFASQTYLTLACYHYGELTGNLGAINMARRCTSKLISLQGSQGEWPWFFDAKRGRVLDFYEVYSVHQYGMAPAFLECAERCDVNGARDALVKGFKWVLGENQLQISMLIHDLQLSVRSQVRKRELRTNKLRMLRALGNAYALRPTGLIDPDNIALRLECRSYELGWILWSFAQRSDLCELTHNQAFMNARTDERSLDQR